MDGMISAFLGAIILFPFIITIVFLILMRKLGKAPASVIGLAADVTTPLLFLAVYVAADTVFGKGIWVCIMGIAIVIAIIYAFIERSKVKEFRIIRLLRKTWRFYFLVLLAAYVFLLIFGTVMKIVEYVK
jgi:quinol-cytochrome oxidoreductase complex cytochrome b subunit